MPWYGLVLIIPAAALGLLIVSVGVAAVIAAGKKTPEPPKAPIVQLEGKATEAAMDAFMTAMKDSQRGRDAE